jgi:hypothetical protein
MAAPVLLLSLSLWSCGAAVRVRLSVYNEAVATMAVAIDGVTQGYLVPRSGRAQYRLDVDGGVIVQLFNGSVATNATLISTTSVAHDELARHAAFSVFAALKGGVLQATLLWDVHAASTTIGMDTARLRVCHCCCAAAGFDSVSRTGVRVCRVLFVCRC